jgi:hypothetical protein
MGINGAGATYRGTFYTAALLNNPINFTFENALSSIASITYPYGAISNVKVTSNTDIDYSPIVYDSFNRAVTTGITVGSIDFGGPYSSVGTNAGISFIVSGGINTSRLYSSNDVNGSANIFKDIFPNTNNFRFEFDEVFAPVAGTTGRALTSLLLTGAGTQIPLIGPAAIPAGLASTLYTTGGQKYLMPLITGARPQGVQLTSDVLRKTAPYLSTSLLDLTEQ